MPTPARSDDSRVRVLTLTRDIGAGFGGAERIAFEFARRLDPTRFRSYVCVTRAPAPESSDQTDIDVAELRDAGVQVLRLERHSSAALRPWARLYALLRRERIDVIHAHMPRASIPGTVLGRLARVPVIVSHEHKWATYRRSERQFLHRNIVGRYSDVVIALSERSRQNMIEVERIPAERIRVLPNAIDSVLPYPAQPREEVRASLGAGPHTALVGTVGRLTWEKGHDDLIRAVKRLSERDAEIRCLIAGTGPEEARLRALIAELDLGRFVQLLGHRADARSLMAAFDVAVLSSKSEVSPLALLEYMAAGAPIVATDVGGIPELVDDGVEGLVVPAENPDRLAAAIRRLLDDRELAARFGSAARERERREFDLDVVVRRLEALYLELLAGSRGGAALSAR